MVEIREASPDDLGELRAMAIRIFETTFAPFNSAENMRAYLDDAFSVSKMQSEFSEPNSICFLSFENDRMTGYARLRENDEAGEHLSGKSWEMQRLYVDVPFQGKGIADALMKTCLEESRKRGYRWLWLGVWEKNFKAQKYYQKQGFERFSEHAFMMGDDRQTDWLLKRKI